jgi:hypothetical protein
MKLFRTTFRSSSLRALALLGFIAAAPMAVAQNQLLPYHLYLFPGLFDNGGAGQMGVASAFHCSNFSGTLQTVQVVVYNYNGTIVANMSALIDAASTFTFATKDTALYSEDLILNTGAVYQGLGVILASTPSIVCTAQVLGASTATHGPTGIDLHGMRFNPFPGTAE